MLLLSHCTEGKLRHTKVNKQVQGHIANQWQSQDSNPGSRLYDSKGRAGGKDGRAKKSHINKSTAPQNAGTGAFSALRPLK